MDSGASVSLIHSRHLPRLPAVIEVVGRGTGPTLYTFNDEPVKSDGEFVIPFWTDDSGDTTFYHNFIATTALVPDAILGLDFLSIADARVQFLVDKIELRPLPREVPDVWLQVRRVGAVSTMAHLACPTHSDSGDFEVTRDGEKSTVVLAVTRPSHTDGEEGAADPKVRCETCLGWLSKIQRLSSSSNKPCVCPSRISLLQQEMGELNVWGGEYDKVQH